MNQQDSNPEIQNPNPEENSGEGPNSSSKDTVGEISNTFPFDQSNGSTENDEETVIRLPVKTESFTGPLDLMVHLITKEELDIFSVSLSTITNEYLKIIKSWQVEDLDIAGEYLVLAATLIRLKARALLPKEEQEKLEDVLSDEVLEQRRIEYERFRHLAEELRCHETRSASLFRRVGPPPEGPKEVLEYTEVSVYDLYRTFQKIIDEIGNQPNHVMKNETYSVDEKMLEIEALIAHNQRVVLTEYLRTLESKLEIIVVFMALLELIRLREIKAQQEHIHGEIVLVKGEKPMTQTDTEQEGEDVLE